MNIKIDNLDGTGARDYSAWVDAQVAPTIKRLLNAPARLRFDLVSDDPEFVVPMAGARVTVGRINGKDLFSGYLSKRPRHRYLGWGTRGPLMRYRCLARSDEVLLDRKRLPDRSPFINRSAGDALRQMTEDLLPGAFALSGIEDVDKLAFYASDPQKTWSESAAEIAQLASGCYRLLDGELSFAPLGAVVHTLDESDERFCPQGLRLECTDVLRNDVTVVGWVEPADYVKDYFVGDGYTTRFYLSQTPFGRATRTLVEEEFATLNPARWSVTDPQAAVNTAGGKLVVAGGTGREGATTVSFVETVEMGAAVILQHGVVTFDKASSGIIGGLYNGGMTSAACVAGFKITATGAQSRIAAILNGQPGQAITTAAGHQYLLTTRLYSSEVYRAEQTFHSSQHGGGEGLGGGAVGGDVRIVLEVHDVDPNDPSTLVAPSVVLYDGVLGNAPGFCTYGLINATSLFAAISFTRVLQSVGAEVRSALPGKAYRTRLVGAQIDGAECSITSDGALAFFSAYVPAENELIEVHYRSGERALSRVVDQASIAATAQGADDGVRGIVRSLRSPVARTSSDCENAAVALLEDFAGVGWTGSYETWSDFLPSETGDVFPGDCMKINAPSWEASCTGIVREVELELKDLDGEHSWYAIRFADESAEPLMFSTEAASGYDSDALRAVDVASRGKTLIADLPNAAVTATSSTTVTLDCGTRPLSGGGIEVRRSDYGWGKDNDRNLAGRFTTQTFTLPRLSRAQDYFIRQYDGSNPPKYSRRTTALHVDFPL